MRLAGLREADGRPGLWLHEDVACWSGGLPRPADLPLAHGRGGIGRVRAGGVVAWIRRYRRGGLLARILPDAFLGTSRAVAEARALGRLAPLGLAPRCLGLQVEGSLLKRMTLAVEDVPGAKDLLAHARDGERDAAAMARAAGRAVRGMHDAGVAHADLNAANVLLRRDASGWRAFVIDLDDARLHEGPVPPSRRVRDVLRLCRSLDKWSVTAGTGAAARGAFLRESLPGGLARRALCAARFRWMWRRRLGRTPRETG